MTKRPEAGHRPPLRPREITSSSITAPSSRERNASRLLPFTSTEEFRTGNEGLFAAVRGELSQSIHYIPKVELSSNYEQPTTVGIASGNNRKIDSMLEKIAPHQLSVTRIPEAEEWHTKDAIVDATSKAVDAARIIQNTEDDERRNIRTRPHVTIANDQLNAIPVITTHPVTHLPIVSFKRLGKPKNDIPENPLESIKTTFQNMADLAEKYKWKSVPYIIELATVIHNPADPNNNAVSLQKSAVFLSLDGTQHLATDRFDEYVTRVTQLLDDSQKGSAIAHIAGGLEFQILNDMGIVEFVSQSSDEISTIGFPPSQKQEAKDHAYRLALAHADEKLIQEYFTGKSS